VRSAAEQSTEVAGQRPDIVAAADDHAQAALARKVVG
jgi:hypothetical protein